jgi:hypothetical protein
VEYEEEIEKRIIPLQKKKQLEELKMLMRQDSAQTGTNAATTASSQVIKYIIISILIMYSKWNICL